jgi:hypothetical protein
MRPMTKAAQPAGAPLGVAFNVFGMETAIVTALITDWKTSEQIKC